MYILLPALGVAFVAFCIWLGVRMVNRRERWAKRLAMAVLASLPMIYAASFGPSIWLVHRDSYPDWIVQKILWFYLPMSWLHENGPGPIGEAVRWWAVIWK